VSGAPVTRPSPSAELNSPVVRVEYLMSAGDWRRDDEVPSPSLPNRSGRPA